MIVDTKNGNQGEKDNAVFILYRNNFLACYDLLEVALMFFVDVLLAFFKSRMISNIITLSCLAFVCSIVYWVCHLIGDKR